MSLRGFIKKNRQTEWGLKVLSINDCYYSKTGNALNPISLNTVKSQENF